MSHGVHAVQHEVEHHIEHEEHGHGGGRGKPVGERGNKKIALLISVMALLLALAEMFGKSAQTEGISFNIKASDSWNFFQAKTIRQTTLRTAAQALALEAATAPDQARAALLKQADDWMNTVARYESDPVEKDGRKELRAQAEAYEHQRDTQLARYHHYEFASAAYQIGIVLASAAVITAIMALVYAAIGLGVIGLAFMALGFFNPHYLHSLHLI
ncbi:MAG: DUF4337 domain-containing protein [Alphaproteobacteria bacterium]|jgi:hypothetical protein|nr:MAG: DUF4337 domain-containing protein [Alphaproteobacteria bacterium]